MAIVKSVDVVKMMIRSSYLYLNFKRRSEMKKFRCILCGYEWESEEENPVCPVCGASGDDVVVVEEDK